jgi:hypothetical protein
MMSATEAKMGPVVTGAAAGRGIRIGAFISTAVFAILMGFSGVLYLTGAKAVVAAIHTLGYPDYFRVLLGIAKIAGVVALIGPVPMWLREWAYAGFTFTLIAAVSSHLLSGDVPAHAIPPLIALAVLMTSYLLRRRLAGAAR